jgi:hypothetical protein
MISKTQLSHSFSPPLNPESTHRLNPLDPNEIHRLVKPAEPIVPGENMLYAGNVVFMCNFCKDSDIR